MGKQTLPKTITDLSEFSRDDAEKLYAEIPKRKLWDALWDLINKTGDHCNGDDAAIIASIWSLAGKR